MIFFTPFTFDTLYTAIAGNGDSTGENQQNGANGKSSSIFGSMALGGGECGNWIKGGRSVGSSGSSGGGSNSAFRTGSLGTPGQ